MITDISIAIMALAFAALVVFLIRTLRSLSEVLAQTNAAVHELKHQLHDISLEATRLLRHTNEVTVDVRNKLHSIDPVVDSVKNIGEAVHEVTASVKQASAAVAGTPNKNVTPERVSVLQSVAQAVQVVPVILDFASSLRQSKKQA